MPEDTKHHDKAMPEHKIQSSGDHSGKSRPRRDDGDVYPAQRDTREMGTHGGPARHGREKDKR